MTDRGVDRGDHVDQERWSEYEDAIERREELYRSGSTIFWELTDLIKLWLEELREVGLSVLDPESQAPPKQAKARGPERNLPWGNTRPVRLEKGKVLWLRFDGDRTEQGYRNVKVSDEPLRTDAAIVAALSVLETTAVNKKKLNLQIKRLGALLHAHSCSAL